MTYKLKDKLVPIYNKFIGTGYSPSWDFEGEIEHVFTDNNAEYIQVRITNGTMTHKPYGDVFVRGHVIAGNINNYRVISRSDEKFKIWF